MLVWGTWSNDAEVRDGCGSMLDSSNPGYFALGPQEENENVFLPDIALVQTRTARSVYASTTLHIQLRSLSQRSSIVVFPSLAAGT